MRFSWDPAKDARNVRERGISFAEAVPMWDSPMLVWIDNRRDYGIHIFSFRKANARETKRYQAALVGEGGGG